MDYIPLPGSLSATLTIKAGVPLQCRDKGIVSTLVVDVGEGYEVLRARVKAVVIASSSEAWKPTTCVYFKPTKYATQKEYKALSDDNFLTEIETAWRGARRRHAGQADFQLELFVYIEKPQKTPTTTMHRATQNRQDAVQPRVREAFEARGIVPGSASLRYATIAQARMPDDHDVVIPDNTTFRQLQFIDQMRETSQTLANQEDEFYPVTVKINDGMMRVPMRVADLRAALGLPAYSLCPPYREPPSVPLSAAPDIDIEDVDHQASDHEENSPHAL